VLSTEGARESISSWLWLSSATKSWQTPYTLRSSSSSYLPYGEACNAAVPSCGRRLFVEWIEDDLSEKALIEAVGGGGRSGHSQDTCASGKLLFLCSGACISEIVLCILTVGLTGLGGLAAGGPPLEESHAARRGWCPGSYASESVKSGIGPTELPELPSATAAANRADRVLVLPEPSFLTSSVLCACTSALMLTAETL